VDVFSALLPRTREKEDAIVRTRSAIERIPSGLACVATLVAAPLAASGHTCTPGETSVLATMPVDRPAFPPTGPTYPEGVAVIDHRVVTSGPANFGTAGNGSPSQLTIFDRHSGALLGEVPVVGEDLDAEHAQSELAAWNGYLYSPNTQLGVLRWKLAGKSAPIQQSVSTPFCSVSIPFPCLAPTTACPADTRFGLPPLPNGIAVAADGTSYVTDSLQGIVWRVAAAGPQGPSAPEVLVCSPALQGSGTEGLSLFGANGIAVDGDDLYVSVTFGPFAATGPTSVIYRLDRLHPAGLEAVYTYRPAEVAPGVFVPPIADGLRLHPKSGHLFVVLGGQNQVSELDLSTSPATEVARYGRNDPDHPFFNPSTVAFSPDGGTAYVSNHAITCCLPGDPSPACTCTAAQDLFGVIEVCL
jgi:DNA-binding beta-propeller fold protein YncE